MEGEGPAHKTLRMSAAGVGGGLAQQDFSRALSGLLGIEQCLES